MDRTEQISKLPKWVQSHIKVLGIRLQEAEARAAQVEGSEDSEVCYCVSTVRGYSYKPLPKHSRVRFRLHSRAVEVECGVRLDGTGVEVRVISGLSGHRLAILPEAANAILVVTQD